MVLAASAHAGKAFAIAIKKKTMTVKVPPQWAPGAQPEHGIRPKSATSPETRRVDPEQALGRAANTRSDHICPRIGGRVRGYVLSLKVGHIARSTDGNCGSTRAPSRRTRCSTVGFMAAALMRARAPNPRPSPARGLRLDTPAHSVRAEANIKNPVDPTDRQ